MRKVVLATDEYYHVYNRGVEKRSIIQDKDDADRFMQSIVDFNSTQTIGSIYEKHYEPKGSPTSKNNSFGNGVSKNDDRLVEFVAYCLNPNHFHFLLRQLHDNGIEQFMQRLGGGYTKYFNHRYSRVGPLFQGPFKAIHVDNDEYLLHLSAYINLNDRIHALSGDMFGLRRSSWDEYLGNAPHPLCTKEIITERFAKISDYEEYARDVVTNTIEGRADDDIRELHFE